VKCTNPNKKHSWKVPLSEINTLLSLKIFGKANYLTGNQLTISLSKRKSFSLDLSHCVFWPACLSKIVCIEDMLLWVCPWAQIYPTLYKPKSTPNLHLKAEIQSTLLILQTAKEIRKVQVSLSEIDTLLSLKIFGSANYFTENKFVVNLILVINEHSYCLYPDKMIINCLITTTLSLTENIKQHISKTSKNWKLQNESYPDFIAITVNCIFQCSYNAHSIHFKTGKSTTALPIRKFYVDPSAIACATCLSI